MINQQRKTQQQPKGDRRSDRLFGACELKLRMMSALPRVVVAGFANPHSYARILLRGAPLVQRKRQAIVRLMALQARLCVETSYVSKLMTSMGSDIVIVVIEEVIMLIVEFGSLLGVLPIRNLPTFTNPTREREVATVPRQGEPERASEHDRADDPARESEWKCPRAYEQAEGEDGPSCDGAWWLFVVR